MITIELNPINSSQKSFYGKATVTIEGEKVILTSYTTKVAEIHFDHFNEHGGHKAIVHGTSSPTTLKHIKEFLLQHGFKAESKAQIEADYTRYVWFDLQDQDVRCEGTLAEARTWLVDFWTFNPFDEEDEPEGYKFEKHMKDIKKASYYTLDDMMGGIDWAIELLD